MCGCCSPLCVRAQVFDPTGSPVLLTTDRPLSDLAMNHCFDLFIQACSLKGINTNTVTLTDGVNSFPMVIECSGNSLHYDSLVNFVNRRCDCCSLVKISCYLGNQPAPGHVVVRECMPFTSFVEPVTAVA